MWLYICKLLTFNSLPTSCRLLITFASSLDPDQVRQDVGPVLDRNCLTLWWYSWTNYLKKLILKKKSTDDKKKNAKLLSMQRVKRHLNFTADHIFSSPKPKAISELLVYQCLRPPSSVRQHFQTSSPLKPLGQLNSNFIWRLLRVGEQKFIQRVLITLPRWLPYPYMVKTL